MSSTTQQVEGLIQQAHEDGVLSSASMNVMVPDLGLKLQGSMGLGADDVQASEVILLGIQPDDSGSIRFAGNSQLVCDGHNLIIDSVSGSTEVRNILGYTRYMNGKVLNSYSYLDQMVRMDSSNYNADQGTPMYDEFFLLLTAVLAKSQEFINAGAFPRSISLLISDGADQHSREQTAASVKTLVTDMLAAENHIIAAMGIQDKHSNSVDFRQVFSEMGIPDEWIMTPKDDPSDIRRHFALFSQSAVRASQSAQSFSQTILGGFGD